MVRNLPFFRSIAFLGLLSVAFAMLVVGCGKPVRRPRARKKDSNAEAVKAADTDFQVAFDFLSDYHQFDSKSVGDRITYHLQRWIAQKQPDPDWVADGLVERLPKRFASWTEELAAFSFDASAFDVAILRESIWAKDLSMQIDAAALHDRRLADWLADQPNENADQTSELETAAKIFDWTVRNIQLEPLPYPAAEIPEGATEDQVEIVTPPDGAMYLPAESLIMGRGDWIARTRVANLIARQAGLATALLAIDQEEGEGEEKPWCWAVLIDGQMYLFDFRLGIPIPTESGDGITTLAAVVENPDVLRKLDLKSDDHGAARKYPVSAEDLKRVVALMDATPESLSQRMKIVERQLAGERKLILTSTPSLLARDLRESPGITGARLWTIAFEIYQFRQDVNRASAMGAAAEVPKAVLLPERMATMIYDMSLVDGSGPMFAAELAEARRQHFRGFYSDTDDETGAKTSYMNCRIPDSEINLQIDLDTMIKHGVIPETADKAAAKRAIEGVRSGMKLTKQHASFWLGLIAFEEGKYSVAVNYLEKRTLAANPDGPWTESATYNLARAYEQWGLETGDEAKIEKSKELLRSLRKAPQGTGNRIRAER